MESPWLWGRRFYPTIEIARRWAAQPIQPLKTVRDEGHMRAFPGAISRANVVKLQEFTKHDIVAALFVAHDGYTMIVFSMAH